MKGLSVGTAFLNTRLRAARKAMLLSAKRQGAVLNTQHMAAAFATA